MARLTLDPSTYPSATLALLAPHAWQAPATSIDTLTTSSAAGWNACIAPHSPHLSPLGTKPRLSRRARAQVERGGLTRREMEVLRLVANGHTDREIAHTLVLSPRTIEMHVANSLGKLGCRSRAHAVSRAAELNLLSGTAALW
jgi:DNA-binding CsgD family transcriptional regulator